MKQLRIMRLALTPGEPAGIGPDLCLQLAQQPQQAELVVIADPQMLRERATQLGLPVKLREFSPKEAPRLTGEGELCVLPMPLARPAQAGRLDPHNANYVLQTLRRAVDGCRGGEFDALVTGPVHKGVINEAGIPFTGHTEFLAELTDTPRVVMMLATKGLRVALATTHLPLAEVSRNITTELLDEVIHILHHDLQQRFGLAQPRILVCGLNPHAGEGGHMGREEIEIIAPVLERLRGEGMQLFGPLPADTLFTLLKPTRFLPCTTTRDCRYSSTWDLVAPLISLWVCRLSAPRSITAPPWTWPAAARQSWVACNMPLRSLSRWPRPAKDKMNETPST